MTSQNDNIGSYGTMVNSQPILSMKVDTTNLPVILRTDNNYDDDACLQGQFRSHVA